MLELRDPSFELCPLSHDNRRIRVVLRTDLLMGPLELLDRLTRLGEFGLWWRVIMGDNDGGSWRRVAGGGGWWRMMVEDDVDERRYRRHVQPRTYPTQHSCIP